MITLIFQIFLWLLAAFLLGLLIGWLVRPFFCKKTTGGIGNAGDHSFINRSTPENAAEADSTTSLSGRSDNRNQRIMASNADADVATDAPQADSSDSFSAKKAAVAVTGLAAAATAYATTGDDDGKKAAEEAARAQIEANRRRAREEANAAQAEQDKRIAEEARLKEAETARLAAERSEAERIAAQKRVTDEAEAAKKQAVEARLAEEKAAVKEEANRIAAQVEAKRLADEQADADIEADRLRLIEDQKLRDIAEAARLAEEKRLSDEIEADRLQLIEQQRIADEREKRTTERAEAERLAEEKRVAADKAKAAQLEAEKAEADRLAEKKRIAAEKAEAARLAEEKRTADEAEAKRLEVEKAEADRLAEEKRIAAEKAEATRLAEEKRAVEEAEAKRLEAQKAEADRLAEEKRIAAEKAETARLAEEKRAADEAEAKRLEAEKAEKAEADRLAEEKRIAAEKAEAARLAVEKRAADEAEAKRLEAQKAEANRLAEEKRIAAEKAEAERLAEEKRTADEAKQNEAKKAEAKSSNTNTIAAAVGIASLAAVATSADNNNSNNTNNDHLADVSDDMRPTRLTSPKGGNPDDLKEIRGIGPAIEKTLNTEGVYHFQQIADFTPDNVRWVDKNVSIPGRVDRDDWIGQAKALSSGQSYQGFAYDPDSAVVTDDMRPKKLSSPTGGSADDLKRIKGVGPVIETTLNDEGIYHFQQVADFTPQNAMWVDKHISFPGRIHREDWIGQAKCLLDDSEYNGHASMMAAELDDEDDTNSNTGSSASSTANTSAAIGSTAASSGSSGSSIAASGSSYDLDNVTEDMRPARLAAPKGGKADDLKEIRGIGPVIEKTLNGEGVYHFQQIADFTPDNVRWVDKNISIPGRVDRDDWIGQAKSLAAGGTYQGFAYDPDSAVITDDMRPQKLTSPTGGSADDLKRIKGIGPVIESTLNDEGIYHFLQIADFTPQNAMWVDKHISFPGRIHREDWIGQAKSILDGRDYNGHATITSGNGDSEADAITDDMRPAKQRLKPNQQSDDLKVINGIGPVIEESLNDEGVYFYQQIADFTDENTRWVDNYMAFPGRIHREDWIGQAKKLVGDNSATISENMKPVLLSKPGAGGAEDLKRIKGVGKVLEKRLHKLGIYHYEQIAALTDDNILWLTDFVSFPEGRIENEDWVGQARTLAEGKRTDYSDRFDSGETPYK